MGHGKYALFKIKTTDKTVYLYCSNVESSSMNEDDEEVVYGIFENTEHVSISVIACDIVNVGNIKGMFSGCSRLTKLDLKNFDTTSIENMACMFSGCYSLEKLDISNFNTENVTYMHNMFYECSRLTKLDLKNFNNNVVLNMNNMFSGCSSLTKLDLKNFNTENVENMAYMFDGCSSLKELNLKSFKTNEVTNMQNMFNGCSGLVKLEFGENFNTKKVENMAYMFDGCCSLKILEFGKNFNTTNVKNMEYMFHRCSSLKNLEFGENFNTENVNCMSNMFSVCSSLKELNLQKFNTTSIENMACMFSGCNSLKELDLNNFAINKKNCKIEKILYYCISLKKLTFSNSLYNNLLNKGGDIFKGCSEIKNFYKDKSDKDILKSISQNKVIEVKDQEGEEQNDEEEKSLENLLSEKETKLFKDVINNLNEIKIGNEINKMKKAVELFPLLDFYLKYINKEDRLYKHIFKIAELYKDFTEEQNLSDYFLSVILRSYRK